MRIERYHFGIFGKVFSYTLLILLLVIISMFLFFSNQIKSTVTITQQRQAMEVFLPLFEQLHGKTSEEIIAFAEDFHNKNSSFSFCFISEDGETLFQTEGFSLNSETNGFSNKAVRLSENMLSGGRFFIASEKSDESRVVFLTSNENGLRLYVASTFPGTSVYADILERAAWIFGFMFIISLFAALLFASRIAKPIKKVSEDTHAMSLLQHVDPPDGRRDEIGKLSKDVYTMYGRLKTTIQQLKTEVETVKRMEENQRYFFSAASHELKTPIAATGAIFEGMLGDVIRPDEYQFYLRNGMKLVKQQDRLVSEILDIVKLNGEMPVNEKDTLCLRQCIDGVLDSLSPIIESKEQMLEIDIPDDITCELNNGLFSKALSNVILNASQNSPNGASIRVYAEEEARFIRLSVWNSGAQIAAEMLPMLYEPFYRADDARSSGDERSGLGLTIVQKALDLMGVAFHLENSDGGVLFYMEILKLGSAQTQTPRASSNYFG